MPTASEVLDTLESLGSEQTRKTWRRHGASDPMFGVKFGDMEKVRKRLGVDHELAAALWASGNADARVLATMIADPARLGRAELERWLSGLTYPGLIDLVAGLAARTGDALALARRWTAAADEWTARAGWTVVAHLAARADELPDALLLGFLAEIEPHIHAAPNRAREAMNRALIAIGGRNDALAAAATAAARRIGPVEIDHGDTSCKTPEAISYIARMREHAARQPAAKKPTGTATKTAKKPAATAKQQATPAKTTAKKPATKKLARQPAPAKKPAPATTTAKKVGKQAAPTATTTAKKVGKQAASTATTTAKKVGKQATSTATTTAKKPAPARPTAKKPAQQPAAPASKPPAKAKATRTGSRLPAARPAARP